jgi:hypothetical protein
MIKTYTTPRHAAAELQKRLAHRDVHLALRPHGRNCMRSSVACLKYAHSYVAVNFAVGGLCWKDRLLYSWASWDSHDFFVTDMAFQSNMDLIIAVIPE